MSNTAIDDVVMTIANRLTVEEKRATVIIGAGVSESEAESTGKLIDSLLTGSGVEREVFDTHARIHFGVNRASKCTMEQLFSIYAKVKYNEERAVSEFLEKHEMPARTSDALPPMGLELLAHLVQHSLINNVISMNFDELLEISLDDEIGEGAYSWVKSLSEFDAFWEFMEREPARWQKKPNLFKAHGTISRPLTLRPTVETVQKFEEVKAKVLKRILDESASLIIVGYRCSDHDFKDVLLTSIRERAADPPSIYWVDTDSEFRRNNDSFKEIEASYKERKVSENLVFIPMSSSDFFVELARSVHQADRMIHNIPRHRVRETVLRNARTKRFVMMDEKKFLLETLIYAVRAKGLFGLNAMMQCRRMANCCKRLVETNGKIWELFHELVREEILFKHHREHQIYYLKEKEEELEALSKKLFQFFEVDETANSPEQFAQVLKDLIEEFDIDIGPPDAQLLLEFRAPRFIRTHKELRLQTQRLIEEALKEIKIIAHTGEWLLRANTKSYARKFIEKRRGIIELILCKKTIGPLNMHVQRAERIRNHLIDKGENGIGIDQENIRYIPWDKNAFHLTISDRGQGIYFGRIAKSPTIVPVVISQPDDFQKLKGMYERLEELADDSPE